MVKLFFVVLMFLFSCKSQKPIDSSVVSNKVLVGEIEIYYNTDTEKYITSSTFNTELFLSDCDLLYFLVQNGRDICSYGEIMEMEDRDLRLLIPEQQKAKQIH